jgi:hypothetical protein
LTPGIIRKRSGVVRQLIDRSDWVKLLTMQDPNLAVEAGQWIRVRNGVYKGDLGLVTCVEAWGAQVLVVPRLKIPTPQANTVTSLKRKRTAIKPEPRLFDLATFSSMFRRQPKLQSDGSYTSRGLVFHHGLLRLKLDLHSISPISEEGIPSQILGLFKLSSHPAVAGSNFPRPEEWIFEEGERVIVSSEKEGTIAGVESTYLEVDFATNEGIKAVSWYSVRKVFSPGEFVSVMSGPSRGTRGWVERVADYTVYILEYKDEGNVSTSFDDTMVSFIQIPADIC